MNDILIQISAFCIGIISSWLGAQVGGGGLITVPFLIFIGLPPHVALGTHRLGAFVGGASSSVKYIRAKRVHWPFVLPFIILGVAGVTIGARILLSLDTNLLSRVIGIAILVPLPFLFFHNTGLKRKKLPDWIITIGFILYFFLTIWAGFFSPGAGTLLLYLTTSFFGLTFIQAHATQRVPAIIRSLALLVIFIHAGVVNWLYGIPLACGYLIGAYLGASYAVMKGNIWVRRLLIITVVVSAVKLLFF